MTELSIDPHPKFTITELGIEFRKELPFEEWTALGKKLMRVGKSIGFLLGDWLNYGERLYYGSGEYGEKYTEAIRTATGFDYQTLANFGYVARKVEFSCRQENLGFEHHAVVAKLKPEEQKKWLTAASSEKMGKRRLRASINAGRVLSVEEVTPDPADKGQTFYLLFINRLCQWFAKRTEHDPVAKWTPELRAMLKRQLQPIVNIFNTL